MITRAAKILLLAGVALFYSLVVFNNLTDFDSNYQFVRHVLSMDSTFPGNHGMGRAIFSPSFHLAFYIGIIAWEIVTTVLLWWGVMWLVAFLSIGAEWFLMWQSHTWNGQEAAFRTFAVVGIVLVLMLQPDTEAQP